MRCFRGTLRQLLVDHSTPNMKTIIQSWWKDCPPQGRSESASAFCRRLIAIRDKCNHFANLTNGNSSNCVLVMGSQPIDNPDYVAPPAAGTDDGRSAIQKLVKIPAHVGIDFAGPLTNMNSVYLLDIWRALPRSTIWHGIHQN